MISAEKKAICSLCKYIATYISSTIVPWDPGMINVYLARKSISLGSTLSPNYTFYDQHRGSFRALSHILTEARALFIIGSQESTYEDEWKMFDNHVTTMMSFTDCMAQAWRILYYVRLQTDIITFMFSNGSYHQNLYSVHDFQYNARKLRLHLNYLITLKSIGFHDDIFFRCQWIRGFVISHCVLEPGGSLSR